MDQNEAKTEIVNRGTVQGQVGSNYGTVINNYLDSSQTHAQQLPLPEHIFLIPYTRNRLFTGREELLHNLHEHFQQTDTPAFAQLQAITGLGGIGKTQLAIEYTYRYRHDYRYILWANATTSLTLTEAYVTIARELQLPLQGEADQTLVVKAVKDWLSTNNQWLLILDNADDLAMTETFLPTGEKGHILLTTREAATNRIAHSTEVEKMTQDEGSIFLLWRAGILPSPETRLSQVNESNQQVTQEIVHELGGLPLALEQAGAYIEEQHTTLATYLKAYRRRQADLLKKQGRINHDYPHSVATTWSLNFEQVEKDDPRAADLLRFLSFLDPDTIPEGLVTMGASQLGPHLQVLSSDDTLLDDAIGTLRHFSLIQRNPDQHLLFMHRLVQAVLKSSMTEITREQWAKQTVRAINQAFPSVEVATWSLCESYLPHALACADLINEYVLTFPEAARLLNQIAVYLNERAQYKQAEPLHQQALAIREQVLGLLHPETASSFNNLALVYKNQGKYKQAELLYQQALAIDEQVLGFNHPKIAICLNNLASLYDQQGKYEQAEPLYQQALAIREQVLGPMHPQTATSLNNLAKLYCKQGKSDQAEPLLNRALIIEKQVLGPMHPQTATSLNNLALVYNTQGKFEQAKSFYQQALTIWEQVLNSNHPEIAIGLNNLASLYDEQGKYDQAEPLYQQALTICERILGPLHPETALILNNLAGLYCRQEKYEQAEPLLRRALAIYEQKLDSDHRITKNMKKNYATVLQLMNLEK